MDSFARDDEFPAPRRKLSGVVNGITTEVSRTDFSDKIFVTISQEGRLSQWIQVPLFGSSAGAVEMPLPGNNHGLLPSTHLTPRTILGAGGEHRETYGHLCASQLASQICLRYPDERRILVLALGLKTVDEHREGFFDLLDLAKAVV